MIIVELIAKDCRTYLAFVILLVKPAGNMSASQPHSFVFVRFKCKFIGGIIYEY